MRRKEIQEVPEKRSMKLQDKFIVLYISIRKNYSEQLFIQTLFWSFSSIQNLIVRFIKVHSLPGT